MEMSTGGGGKGLAPGPLAALSLESDDIQPPGEPLADRIGELALCGDVASGFETIDGDGGRHPRPDIAQEIDADRDVQGDDDSEITHNGGQRERDASLAARGEMGHVAVTQDHGTANGNIDAEGK